MTARTNVMNPGELDLNLLWALHAILRERHVTRAGLSIGLGQPAMSAALSRLRRVFDDDLLVRVGGENRLTPLAIELTPAVNEIIASVGTLVSKHVDFDPAREKRVFSILATDLMTVLALSPVMRRIFAEAPGISLQIFPLLPNSPEVEAGVADFMISPSFHAIGNLSTEVIFEDRYVAAVWKGHSEVHDRLTIEQYQRLPHVSFGTLDAPPHLSPDELNQRDIHVACRSYWSMPFLLTGTPLIAVVPESLGLHYTSLSEIRLVELPKAAEPFQARLAWHPRHDDDQAFLWLRGLIREACAESFNYTLPDPMLLPLTS